MSTVQEERVLVVPTSLFHELGHFQGFSREVDRYVEQLLRPENVSYRPRGEVEQDPSFKQLIPYMIFRHRNGDLDSIFQYTRGGGMGEKRLHRLRSVGIGGHISACDIAADDPYEEGLQRELSEEVRIETVYDRQLVGMINDDETEVGQVHLGMVYLFDVEQPKVYPNEEDILKSGFEPVESLLEDLTGFETWSSLSLSALVGGKATS